MARPPRALRQLEQRLAAYGELAVRVGLNLSAGQRLLIIGPLAAGGASLEAAPLVRQIVASAYRAGAPLVEVVWGDEALQLLRFQYAPRDSFGEFLNWLPKALFEHAEAGHAVLSVYAMGSNGAVSSKSAPSAWPGCRCRSCFVPRRASRRHSAASAR